MALPRRPKAGVDDLDEMMKAFEKSDKTSVDPKNVVNKRKTDSENLSAKKPKSKFAEERAKKKVDAGNQQKVNEVEDNPKIELVVGAIVEKNVAFKVPVKPPKLPIANEHSKFFPDVVKIELNGGDDKNQNYSKQSMFARHFKLMKKSISKELAEQSVNTVYMDVNEKVEKFGERSFILDHSNNDANTIHEENVAKLSSLTEEEIREEQQKLLTQVDPKLLSFLKNRRKNKTAPKPRDVCMDDLTAEVSVDDLSRSDSIYMNVDPPNNCGDMDIKKPAEMNIDEPSKFPHMDVAEPAKFTWMSDLPPATPSGPDNGLSARFDFSGYLLCPDDKVNEDVGQGLHHHGDEPERAGYTLEELLTLIRSSNAPQRVIGLSTLTKIFDNYQQGLLDQCLVQNLLVELLQAGLLALVRVCLDQKEESVVSAGVTCLSSLLYNATDEIGLDITFHWISGLVQPSLPGPPLPPDDPDNPTEEQNDHELSQTDVVKALLRMDTLERLHYLLSVVQPGPATVLATLTLMCRMARHSLNVADLITRSGPLIEAITKNFIPSSYPPEGHRSVYGSPVWQAVKLMRILCSRGRHIATTIANKCKVTESLLIYLSIEPSEALIPATEAIQLCLECYRTWTTLLSYGLATRNYLDLYPVLARRILFYLEKVDLDCDKLTRELGVGLLGVLKAATSAAGCGPPSLLSWDHVAGLIQPVETCVAKWLAQAGNGPQNCDLLSAALNCLQNLYRKVQEQRNYNPVAMCDKLKELFCGAGNRLLQSEFFKSACQSLASGSGYLSGLASAKRATTSLPAVNAACFGGHLHPALRLESNINFLSSVFRFASSCHNIHKQLPMTEEFFQYLVPYMSSLVKTSELSVTFNWFSRHEAELLYWICILHTQKPVVDRGLVHKTALVVTQLLQTGDESLLINLLTRVVFCQDYIKTEIYRDLGSLSLADPVPLLISGSAPVPDVRAVTEAALQNITSIKDTYFKLISLPRVEAASNAIKQSIPQEIKNLTQRNGGETILASDWPYLPLLSQYNYTQDHKQITKVSPEDTRNIRNCLAWVQVTTTKQILTPVDATSRFVKLATVFLAGPDLFLDPTVHSLTLATLRNVLDSEKLDLSLTIPGLSSSHELYMSLLEQFEGVSYGDQLFSLILIPAMAMSQPLHYRKSLWTEHPEAIRLITLSPLQIKPMGINQLISPGETEVTVLTSQFRSLLDGRVTEKRNPLLYSIAVSHIKQLLNKEQEDAEANNVKKFIEKQLEQPQNSKLAEIFG